MLQSGAEKERRTSMIKLLEETEKHVARQVLKK